MAAPSSMVYCSAANNLLVVPCYPLLAGRAAVDVFADVGSCCAVSGLCLKVYSSWVLCSVVLLSKKTQAPDRAFLTAGSEGN